MKFNNSEELHDPQCPENWRETNKTECVYLKNNYNSIDLTEVEQIDEGQDEWNEIKPDVRPTIGDTLKKVILSIVKKFSRLMHLTKQPL